jgi:hypothetical protein
VRPLFAYFQAYQEQMRLLARSQRLTRRIFFDPSLSFDPTKLEPRSLSWRRSLGLAAQKMVSTTVLFSDHDRNGSPTQAVSAHFFIALVLRQIELPGQRNLTQIVHPS